MAVVSGDIADFHKDNEDERDDEEEGGEEGGHEAGQCCGLDGGLREGGLGMGLGWIRARGRMRWSAEFGGAGGLDRWLGEPLWLENWMSWFQGV